MNWTARNKNRRMVNSAIVSDQLLSYCRQFRLSTRPDDKRKENIKHLSNKQKKTNNPDNAIPANYVFFQG